MAKSLRSKWRRKCRAVKRVRYGEKELNRLKKIVDNDPHNKPADVDMEQVSKIATIIDKTIIRRKSRRRDLPSTSGNTDEVVEVMETNDKVRVFNPKTMKDQHGTYPVWMHPRKIHKKKKVGKGKLKLKKKSTSKS